MLLVVLAAAARAAAQIDLPASALVTMDTKIAWPVHGAVTPACRRFTVTRADLKRMLRTYHRLSIPELDNYSSDGSCEIRGRITVNGKQYHWRKNPGNDLLKDFGSKEGEDVLGGEPNPAPPESPAQLAREQHKREKPILRQRQPVVLLLNHDFALPPDAIIRLGRATVEQGTCGNKSSNCEGTPRTPAAVRRIFRRYHEVASREMHDWYAYYGCGVDGSIRVRGRNYRFHYTSGNTLTTNFPDGFDHELGGRYTDDLGLGG